MGENETLEYSEESTENVSFLESTEVSSVVEESVEESSDFSSGVQEDVSDDASSLESPEEIETTSVIDTVIETEEQESLVEIETETGTEEQESLVEIETENEDVVTDLEADSVDESEQVDESYSDELEYLQMQIDALADQQVAAVSETETESDIYTMYDSYDAFMESPVYVTRYEYEILNRLEFIQYALCILIALIFLLIFRRNTK